MKITRLVELSLYFKMQEILSVSRKDEKPKSANYSTYNLKYSNVQTDYPFIVKVNNEEVDSSLYSINYRDGSITFASPLNSRDIVGVSYTYCPVNVYDESKNPSSDDFKYPAVAIYEDEREDVAVELGSNKKELHPTWIMEVWSERGGERNDITDTIMEFFEEGLIPIVNYNVAFPINEDGSKNEEFDSTSSIYGYMYCDSINYRKGGSLDIGDKPKYLSEIILDLTINK